MHESDEPFEEKISKSQRKREATALQALGERLVELRREQLGRLPLPERLLDAVLAAQRIHQRGGRKRQLQYIGKLMREIDAEPVRNALDAMELHSREASARFHRLEHWRERLLAEGDEALTELLQQYPHADHPRLRQLVRNARQDQAEGKPPRAARLLFRYLRELQEQAP